MNLINVPLLPFHFYSFSIPQAQRKKEEKKVCRKKRQINSQSQSQETEKEEMTFRLSLMHA
jgi:hypothetical protein